jgi:sugar lactone lactonase YvrE
MKQHSLIPYQGALSRLSALLLTIGACAFTIVPSAAQDVPARYRISTFAGGPTRVDGIPAASGYLNAPSALAVGADGAVYFSELYGLAIRKVTPEGLLATVVGNGSGGPLGDDGPAASAHVGALSGGIALDSQGNLYFAETNTTVRKVDAKGVVTRFAGTGQAGFSGDGGPARQAQLGSINALAIDAQGQLYIATADNRVRRVATDGTIQTVAGNGQTPHAGDGGLATQAALSTPVGLGVDGAGNLYIAESSSRIRRVSVDGVITNVAGSGSFGFSRENAVAASASLGILSTLTVTPDGTVYFVEQSQNLITAPYSRLRKLTREGRLVTVAGGHGVGSSDNGTLASEAQVGQIMGLAVDARGNLFLADAREHRIQKVDPTGTLTTLAGMERFAGDGRRPGNAVMNLPTGVVTDSSGNIYVGEAWGLRIRRVDAGFVGGVSTFAGNGLFGAYGDGFPAIGASFAWLNQMAFLADGSLLIADFSNNRVRRIDLGGTITTFAGNGQPGGAGDGGPSVNAQLTNPFGIAVDPSGNVYISETFGHRIRVVTPDGKIDTIAGTGKPGYSGDGGAAHDAQLSAPRSLALDSQGNLYIADANNFRIRRISPDGVIQTAAGNGKSGLAGDHGPATDASIYAPFGVLVDSFGAVLFTGAPGYGGVVRRLRPDGTIDTIAGTGVAGSDGDGGFATAAQFNFPDSLAMDASGRILVTDRFNHRVRVLTPVRE